MWCLYRTRVQPGLLWHPLVGFIKQPSGPCWCGISGSQTLGDQVGTGRLAPERGNQYVVLCWGGPSDKKGMRGAVVFASTVMLSSPEGQEASQTQL